MNKYIYYIAIALILLYFIIRNKKVQPEVKESEKTTDIEPLNNFNMNDFIINAELEKTYKEPLKRGERNNNWGNIKKAPIKWVGEVEGADKTFCMFSKVKYGLRAMYYILYKYQRVHKLTTIEQIIKRWSATDQATYIKYVSAVVGIKPTDYIDLKIRDNFYLLCKAMVKVEIGKDRLTRPLFDETIKMININ